MPDKPKGVAARIPQAMQSKRRQEHLWLRNPHETQSLPKLPLGARIIQGGLFPSIKCGIKSPSASSPQGRQFRQASVDGSGPGV
ncbi:hypothetical protein ACJ72_00097 [Emergomyces africanus]|uniref:Uncharacterized protein n=1 Tax=Emergomyces africanus TaxID=1955775 RepID=A0A1B7P957_9EURO|nr:hypothetical protein ACJ72_00097 [Emergomyces africanus]